MSEERDVSPNAASDPRELRRQDEASASLSAPWSEVSQSAQYTNVGAFLGSAAAEELTSFVERRSQVHEAYIREQAKNKRMGLVLAFILILAAAGVMTFAPEGRQNLSYWVGAALVLFAAGCVGFGRVWGKTKSFSFGASQDGDSPD